ncbi:MAG: restriction endonuclease [Nitrospirales bacterium]|nr:restriction endonuclease [Nitrospirales bacterium]
MAESVVCNNCDSVLCEEPSEVPEERKPCPNCGSTVPRFSVSAAARIQFESLTRVTSTATMTVISSTNLLLQTVIVPGAKTVEGQLIKAVAWPWFEIIALLSRDPSLAYEIKDRKWEEIIAGAYQKAGFDEVTLTPRSGDLGRDIIAVKRGVGTVRIIDQVKAYGPNHLVTANDVRALLGVLQGDKASKGFLTTTSDFAPKLRDDILLKPFMPARLELINSKMLLARLEELAKKNA